MSTENQAADSISDALNSAFEESTEVDNAGQVVAEAEGVQKTEQEKIQEILEAPTSWPEETRTKFGELAKVPQGNEWQKWLVERHKSLEQDATKKWQEAGDIRKQYEPINKLFEPYQEALKQANMTVPDLIQRYIQADQFLAQDPVNAIKWFMQDYGVDVSQLAGEAPKIDPVVQRLHHELSELKRTFTTREQAESQARMNATLNEINVFSDEKDESGKPTRPHFQEVVNDMVVLAQAEKAAGREPKLQDLYDRAVWANPDVRKKLLAAQSELDAKKRAEEAAQKAARAGKASASVSGSPGATAPRTDRSLREELEAQIG